MPAPHRAAYWRFTVPLLFLLPAKTTGRLIQNAVLLMQPQGVRELAAFAIAAALFQTFANILGMGAQATTVWAEDRAGYRHVRRYLVRLALASATLLTLVMTLPMTHTVVGRIYRLDADLIGAVVTYLGCFALVLPIQALLKVCEGVLLRAHRSGLVTTGKIAEIALVAAILAGAGWVGVPARIAIVFSVIVPELLVLPLMWIAHCRVLPRSERIAPDPEAEARPSLSRMYLPMAATTMLFTVSRPIIFALITATYGPGERSENLIAAATLAFTTGFLFQGQINATRQVLVTFRDRPRREVRRFVITLTATISAAMLLFVATPAADWFLDTVQQARGEVLAMARAALWPLILAMPLIAWRNWFHGLGMANRRTGAMALGGIGRNLATLAVGGGLALSGHLDHIGAMLAMVAAFGAEAVTTVFASRRWRRERLSSSADAALAS